MLFVMYTRRTKHLHGEATLSIAGIFLVRERRYSSRGTYIARLDWASLGIAGNIATNTAKALAVGSMAHVMCR